MKKKEEII